MKKVEGSVNLSINELDALRGTISQLENDKIKLKDELNDVINKSKQVRIHLLGVENYKEKVTDGNWYDSKSFGYHYVARQKKYEKIEYVNFDDVRIDYERELDKNMEKRILGLYNEINSLQTKYDELKISSDKLISDKNILHRNEIQKLEKIHFEEIEKLKEIKNTEIKALYDKIEILENEERKIGKDELITELKAALVMEKSKKWYNKIFK